MMTVKSGSTRTRAAQVRRKVAKPGRAETSLTDHCAQEVMESVPFVMRFIRKEMRQQGAAFLSVPQLRTLIYLSRSPGTGLSSVADHLGVTLPTASAIVTRLVQRGLVTRVAYPKERRCVVLTLTRSGSRRLRRIRQATCSLVANVLTGRSLTELRKISEGIALLGKVFKDSKGAA